MYEIDVSSVEDFLRSVVDLAGGALRLDPDAFAAVKTQEGGPGVALTIAFLAGLSMMLGQSAVLLANRVSRRRFVLSIVLGALVLILGFVLWATSSWLIAWLLLDQRPRVLPYIAIVALAHAPLLLGFFVLLPYVGLIVHKLLRVYVLLALLVGLYAGYQASFWQAVLCAVVGWLLVQLIFHLGVFGLERRRRFPWWTDTRLAPVDVRERLTEQFAREHGLLPEPADDQPTTGARQ
jgi:hypothetical protein